LLHFTEYACAFARDKAGNNSAARIAMMAMTTRSSIKVKASTSGLRIFWRQTLIQKEVQSALLPCYSVRFIVPVPQLENLVFIPVEELCQLAVFHVSVTENHIPPSSVPSEHRDVCGPQRKVNPPVTSISIKLAVH